MKPSMLLLIFFLHFASCSTIIEAFRVEGRNPRGESNGPECACVPYYLCQNNSVITDGVGLIDIRSRGPCENYLDVCCDAPSQIEEGKSFPEVAEKKNGCGRRNPDGIGFRITGDSGGEAQFAEFPWMVAVLREGELDEQKVNVYQCGGALIHPQVVVTAAHCVNAQGSGYRIRAGEWDTQTASEQFPHQDMNVKSIVAHPDYFAGALYNDVALLFLEEDLRLGNNVDTVCLPDPNDSFDLENCFASGWGKDVYGKQGKYQVILKKVELPIVPHRKCEAVLRTTRLGHFFRLHKSFLCAGGEAGKDTCKGDGGSPLVCPMANSDRYSHVGIVAWGIGCGEDGVPGVYANVAAFRHWIDNQFLLRDLDTKYYET